MREGISRRVVIKMTPTANVHICQTRCVIGCNMRHQSKRQEHQDSSFSVLRISRHPVMVCNTIPRKSPSWHPIFASGDKEEWRSNLPLSKMALRIMTGNSTVNTVATNVSTGYSSVVFVNSNRKHA